METCNHCGDEFESEEMRPLRYEPELKVCEGCYEQDLDEDE